MEWCTETDQPWISVCMLIGYMHASTDGDRQVLDLQRAALRKTVCSRSDGKPQRILVSPTHIRPRGAAA
jgi:hypothetical protein